MAMEGVQRAPSPMQFIGPQNLFGNLEPSQPIGWFIPLPGCMMQERTLTQIVTGYLSAAVHGDRRIKNEAEMPKAVEG